MNRNYSRPKTEPRWADVRETHPAVAMAIHAIADTRRSPEAIWDDPTPAEWDHVTMAVQEYLDHGDFEPSDDGRYAWGLEAIEIKKHTITLTPDQLGLIVNALTNSEICDREDGLNERADQIAALLEHIENEVA